MRRLNRDIEFRGIVATLAIGILIYLIGGPLLMLVISSFRLTTGLLPFSEGVSWSLENYGRVFLNPATLPLLFNTFVFTVGALSLGFAISVGLAWLTERTDVPLRNVIFVLIVASIGIPNVILGIAWEFVLNPVNGLLNIALRTLLGLDGRGPLNVFTLPGLVFVQGISLVPITYLLVSAAFRAIDVTLEDAASISGAPYRTVARRITLPLLAPALLSALVYQFVTVIESFDIPLIIGLRAGIPVLSTQIFIEANPPGGLPNYGVASTYSLFLLALALLPLLAYNRVMGRAERYATITGRNFSPRRIELGSWRTPLALAALSFIFISFVLPGLVLVWTSLLPFYSVPSAEALGRVSLDAYVDVLSSSQFRNALTNTAVLGITTAFATLSLSTLIAWILVRTRSRLRVGLDFLAFMPHAMPGVIIGLSILLIYLILPVPLVDTIWIIVIALTTQSISIATRLMSSAIAQVKLELEEAAEVSGAPWMATMRRVVGPLIFPAFANGCLLVFLLSIKNLTLALILFSGENVVLSTLVFSHWDQGETGQTAAVGLVMVAMTLSFAILMRLINRERIVTA